LDEYGPKRDLSIDTKERLEIGQPLAEELHINPLVLGPRPSPSNHRRRDVT
jgi:hypothetical protein